MNKIEERSLVKCPLDRAPSYLVRYLDSLGKADENGKTVLKLEVPFDEISLTGAFGDVFDAAIGGKIAHAMARALLNEPCNAMENAQRYAVNR